MQENGKIDISLTLKAWADIVLDKWHASIINIPVIDTGLLRDSLKYTLFINAGSNIDKIEFSFKLYGIFVAHMYRKGQVKKNESNEDWFSKRYYAQVMKLNEIIIEKYGIHITHTLSNIISAPLDEATRQINVSI